MVHGPLSVKNKQLWKDEQTIHEDFNLMLGKEKDIDQNKINLGVTIIIKGWDDITLEMLKYRKELQPLKLILEKVEESEWLGLLLSLYKYWPN